MHFVAKYGPIFQKNLLLNREAYVLSILSILFAFSPLKDQIIFGFQNRLNFVARQALDMGPKMSEKIKIVSFDDKSLAQLGRPELNDLEWSLVLKSLYLRKPRAILVDKIFATGINPVSSLDFLTSSSQSKFKNTKIILGSFVTDVAIPHRAPMVAVNSLQDSMGKLSDLLPIRNGFQYGPAPELLPFFEVGHFAYKGDGFVDSVLQLKRDFFVPHVSLLVAKHLEAGKNGLKIEDKMLNVQDLSHTFVNFIETKSLRKNEYSLNSVLKAAQNDKPISFVNEDDVVLVLPLMFTGNTDFKSSPLGDVPGGYVLVAMVQSVIQGKFIESLSFSALFLSGLSLLGLLLIFVRRLSFFAFFWLGGTVLLAALGLSFFAWFSYVVPWLQASVVYFSLGASAILGRQRETDLKVGQISSALSGLVSPSLLTELIKSPHRLNFDPSETVLTVMFVDVVGFSVVSETRSALEVFDLLKVLIKDVTKIIHEHGGVVDKTLGDGMVCYFGYRFLQKESIDNHADAALNCALKIQRENANRWFHKSGGSEVVLPLRIGLNSGPVYIGNLGNEKRVDFSLIGHTVNYAKRLEDSCEPFRIMIGKGTIEQIGSEFIDSLKVQRRFLSIKHHVDLWEGFEIDPFQNDPEVFSGAVEAYREFAGEKVKDPRWSADGVPLPILANGTTVGTLIDFSKTGLSVFLPQYLALKVTISLDFPDPVHQEMRRQLQAAGVSPMICEVRWGRPEGDGFRHGLLIKNLTDEKREMLVLKLKESLGIPT